MALPLGGAAERSDDGSGKVMMGGLIHKSEGCMVSTTSEEKTTPMLTLKAWGCEVRFGNLLKQGSVNSLLWYTVELSAETSEIYVFDAGSIFEGNFSFSSDIDESVRQACALAEHHFKSFEVFSHWVRANFYTLSR